jgi:hypothetical protein
VNEGWISPSSLEWLTLKPRSWYRARRAQVVVERPLDAGPVVGEPPHPVGRAAQDHETDEPLYREHTQDDLVA